MKWVLGLVATAALFGAFPTFAGGTVGSATDFWKTDFTCVNDYGQNEFQAIFNGKHYISHGNISVVTNIFTNQAWQGADLSEGQTFSFDGVLAGMGPGAENVLSIKIDKISDKTEIIENCLGRNMKSDCGNRDALRAYKFNLAISLSGAQTGKRTMSCRQASFREIK